MHTILLGSEISVPRCRECHYKHSMCIGSEISVPVFFKCYYNYNSVHAIQIGSETIEVSESVTINTQYNYKF